MNYGLDLLGGARYGKTLIKNFPIGWSLGIFDNTFGPAAGVVEKLLASGKCPHVRIQMLWSDSHRFGDSDIKKIKAIAKQYEKLAQKYPAKIELSPFCEHNLNNPDKYLSIVQQEAPSCTPVNTPWKGAISRKFKNEIHGDHKKPPGQYNYSYDGTNAVDSNVEADKLKHSGTDTFFFWHPRFNLKWSMKDTTPRPNRKALPSKELIQSVVYLATDKGAVSVRKNWLVKSHAEKHDAKDQKGDKLLIISPLKADKILLKANAKTIATLNYYGTFDGGGYRYYAKTFGYQIAVEAFKQTGSSLCEIWLKGNKHGACNPGFRDPTFR